MKTIHMPNDPVVTFQIDDSILTPKIGQILLLKFEDYITDPEEWELMIWLRSNRR
ncbi:hypothetical protein [Algoriphagus persicinus]|uniref:hypothetical protein n=1 Tax=Algoriphagus persicinus TaxID=3108754 RepID=UPI002B3E59CC|nr:hypothetical protein [Algoriphagus sp. E1-3-M2]MEB2783795.1 hypothetical protein [Algoriphagus sp. E1-3-M2]